MPKENRQAACRLLWLCQHQLLRDPCQGTLSNPPRGCRASGNGIKLKLAANAGKKQTNYPKTTQTKALQPQRQHNPGAARAPQPPNRLAASSPGCEHRQR